MASNPLAELGSFLTATEAERLALQLDTGTPVSIAVREIAIARQLAQTYATQIGSHAVQLLGGHGYVNEYPNERWYRDLRGVGVLEGTLLV